MHDITFVNFVNVYNNFVLKWLIFALYVVVVPEQILLGSIWRACTKRRNVETKRPKRNGRNHRNDRNDRNETTETKRPKRNDRNETTETKRPKRPKRNNRNDRNETAETKRPKRNGRKYKLQEKWKILIKI